MNTRISISRITVIRSVLISVLVAVPPCWAQLIDQTTEVSVPAGSRHHAFSLRVMKIRPEVNPASYVDYARITEPRPVSTTVIEQIGKVKAAVPSRFGLHYSMPGRQPGI
jgi:hypothetical protein